MLMFRKFALACSRLTAREREREREREKERERDTQRETERELIFTNYVDLWLQFIKIFLQILSAVCINVVMVLLCKRELKFC